ncbi:Mitochondrial inner membrane protease ATP23-like protein [Trichoplax sp. H2]|nr:Mitochondrial inner membrane protease ATP23-like protein [Trichoplax sp. H2]|eukprot:RDD44560.1 Mitochondrial inner membrane protease ATP23-like protein [Trichoplax sp. H2]
MAEQESSEAERINYPARHGPFGSNNKHHVVCEKWKNYAIRSPYVKFMLESMKKLGCEVNIEKQLVCEPCSGNVLGGFDSRASQIVLCENTIYSPGCMKDVLTHELIHAYDHCRAHVDWRNIHHLACSEIRAANLSGDCFFWKENLARFNFGLKQHQQKCVKDRAVKSILCVMDVDENEARNAVDTVFDSCFADLDPFDRIPP